MGGVAAAASLFVSSSNSIQIVRRHCCLGYAGCLAFFLALGVGRKLTMGGLVDRELTLASGKQKEKSCNWEGLLIGEWCKECFVFLF